MPNALGLEDLLDSDGFFAHLLGRTPSGRRRTPLFGPDLPVVLLTGGPGMGKERLLDEVHRRFTAKVPVVRLDCGSSRYADRASAVPDARSTTTETLLETAAQLNRWEGTGGSFAFPRLFAGLAVVATGADGGSSAAVAGELDRIKRLPVKNRRRRQRDGEGRDGRRPGGWNPFWRGLVRDGVPLLSPFVAPFPADLLALLASRLVDHLASRHGQAELKRLYGSYPTAGGQPENGLRNLAQDFAEGGTERALAESFLFRALREDLDAAYASASGWLLRVGRPGLLLNRSESPLGEHLLRAVLTDRRSGRRDRVVIVGTAQRADGGAFLQEGPPQGDEPVAPREFRPIGLRRPAWERPDREPVGGPRHAPLADGVMLLRMPLLSADQTEQEITQKRARVEADGSAIARRVNAAVMQLSGGRPQTVLRLAEAASSFHMSEDTNYRRILDVPVRLESAGGETSEEQPTVDLLLKDLVVRRMPVALSPVYQDRWLDLLTHLSVAHDDQCARVLLQYHQTGLPNQLRVHEVSRLLADTGWPSCERHFIGDFGLRQMLLHRLYGLRPGGALWHEDHELLHDHYERTATLEANAETPVEPPPDAPFKSAMAHAMHHRLASGDVDDVARRLAGTLPDRVAEWCEELLAIAQAPFPHTPDTRRERAEGRVDYPDDVPRLQRTVDRLLHAVWVCEERTRLTGTKMADTLNALLNRLASMDFRDAEQFSVTATAWSEKARKEQPLRHCSCTERLARRG